METKKELVNQLIALGDGFGEKSVPEQVEVLEMADGITNEALKTLLGQYSDMLRFIKGEMQVDYNELIKRSEKALNQFK